MKNVKVYIGVTQGISFYSKIIKWFQWGNPNVHTFYIEKEQINKKDPIVIEAIVGYGVHRDTISTAHTKNTKYIIYSTTVTKEQKQLIEEFLYDNIGKDYDIIGLLGFGFRRNTNDKNKYFCSELLYEAFKHAGVDIFRTLRPEQVYPSLFIESPIFKEEYSSYTI